ncbi:hypothetical protein GCM10023115_22610 [Pontixanthobacter gangjinensis]|uniref:Glycosyltransferase n=1 Tax=Pontixanthobacter gangjinensis TaxID=1028742 RepID=A0A6I4SP35_9SPHN|nr:glycosyltransferase family 2 protein [Pontixanthobacter gangjinensis]MXO57504.1 glycosyltransferase [Pontixanthobacter gangjinensis]
MADVSIIIPSHNGSDTLPQVFEALDVLSPSEHSVEYILVNNASADKTSVLMDQFLEGHEGVYLSESRKGKSFALNLALSRASGELLVFLDDDIIPDPHWLSGFISAAATHEEIDLFAGSLRPAWPKCPANWQANLAARGRSFGCTEEGRPNGDCPPELVKGGNFAIRQSSLGKVQFDEQSTNFGSSAAVGGGEDTLFASEIVQAGGKIQFTANASAKHIIHHDEMTIRSISNRYRRIGTGVAARAHTPVMWLALPFSFSAFAALAAFGWLLGRRSFAALQMTRAASRLGRLDYAISKLRG